MIAELLVVLAVLGGGCALLRTAGIRDWGLLPLGFLAGVCLMIGAGFVQVATGLPTAPEITLVVVLGAPVAWWIAAWRRGRDVRVWPPAAVVAVLSVAAAVAVLREARMLKWHSDSLTYLMAGRLIAEGDYRSTASTELLTTRVLGVPLLHAPADLGGALYLRSITPLLAAATLAAVVWFVWRAGRGLGYGRFAAVAGLAGLLLLTNNRVVFSFFYLNGHLLVAACVVLVAGSGWLLANARDGDRDTRQALVIMQVLAVPVIVVTRPEGFLLAALVLLPTALSAHLTRAGRAAVLASFGGACLLFAGLQFWVFIDRDTSVPPVVLGGAVVGAGALAAIPLLPRLSAGRRGPRLLALAEAGLWLGLLALAVRAPDTLRTSLRATYRNLFEGYGGYGLSIVVLVGLLLLAWLLSPPLRHAAHLRFPLTTFLPLCLVLAYLREGAYRAADADSMNRMLMHVVPLAVLLLFALVTGAGRDVEAPPREPAGAGAGDALPAAAPQPAAVP